MRKSYPASLLILLFVLLFPAKEWATDNFSFKHIDDNMGLSSNTVKCITEDSYGFMWFGTANGLHRYDGVGIKQFNCYDFQARKGNNNIGALYEDEHKRLWVGTDRGIYVYSPVESRFSFVDRRDPKNNVACDNWVQTITGDGHGNVWALLPDVGVFRYHGETETEFFHITPTGNFKVIEPSDICVSNDGNVWVCTTGDGIYKFDFRRHHFDKIASIGNTPIVGIHFVNIEEDGLGNLVLMGNDGTLYYYRPQEQTISKIPFSAAGHVFGCHLQCFNNEIWVGTRNGIYIVNTDTNKERIVRSNPQDAFSLSNDAVNCIYKSRIGDAWVGTLYGGVNFLPIDKFCFIKYGYSSGLTGTIIRGMAQASDGNIWIGTCGQGLYVLNPRLQRIDKSPMSASADGATIFISSVGSELYVGSEHNGMNTLSLDGDIKGIFKPKESDNGVYCYLRDSRGTEWVGMGYTLYRRQAGSKQFVRVGETGYDWIFCMTETRDGNIWFGTMGNGLWRYTPNNKKFKCYISDDNCTNGLRSNCISSLYEDSRGRLWVSTDRGGLSRYDKRADRFTTYGTGEGLPDNVVYNVLEDAAGFLWFGTNKGLVKFSPQHGACKVFTTKDGLPCNQFNYNAAVWANDGLFYFGSTKGVVAFDPMKESLQQSSAEVFFTRLSVRSHEVETDGNGHTLFKGNILFADKITLPHDVGTFALDVAMPNFGVTAQQEYSYKIDDYKDEWLPLTDYRISFTDLPPGTYKLRVRAESYGHTSERLLTIRILPPWWKSVWAYCAYLLLFVLAVSLWFVWYRRRKEQQARERQELFALKKEQELYQDKVNFFTQIAHEIRTPLTLIDAPLEAIEEIGTKDKRIAHYLHVTRQNTKRLLSLVTQLLDFQRIGKNHMEVTKGNVDIRALVGDLLDRFEATIKLRGKSLSRSVEGEILVASTDSEAVTKILSNLLNNALKYARRDIRVAVAADHDDCIISVWSDGDRIEKADESRIFEPFYQIDKSVSGENGVGIGLPLSRSLAELLGGSLTLASAETDTEQKGNTFILRIPLDESDVESNNVEATRQPEEVFISKPAVVNTAGATVLIVEDNDNMREFLAAQANRTFNIETARNGREAVSKLKSCNVDLVVTDVMMPEMNGFELCRYLKADVELSHVPVVFITAKNDLESKIEGLRLGAEAYIEKPFSVKYFRQLIQSLLDNRSRERENFSRKPFFGIPDMHLNKTDQEFMDKAQKVVIDHITESDFSVEQMASLLCMSHSSLLRKFKAVQGCLPAEFIRVVRLKRAAELIAEGRYRMADVCFMVGLTSPSYFSKVFLKQFGVTPKDFERQCMEKNRTSQPTNNDKNETKEQ